MWGPPCHVESRWSHSTIVPGGFQETRVTQYRNNTQRYAIRSVMICHINVWICDTSQPQPYHHQPSKRPQGGPNRPCRTWSLRMCPAPGCKTKMNTMNSVVCGECRSKVAHLDMGFSMGFSMGFPMGLAHWKWCPFGDYGRVQGVGLPEFLPEPIELQWLPVEIRLSELCLCNLYIFTDCIVRKLMFPDMFYHISYIP